MSDPVSTICGIDLTCLMYSVQWAAERTQLGVINDPVQLAAGLWL